MIVAHNIQFDENVISVESIKKLWNKCNVINKYAEILYYEKIHKKI